MRQTVYSPITIMFTESNFKLAKENIVSELKFEAHNLNVLKRHRAPYVQSKICVSDWY